MESVYMPSHYEGKPEEWRPTSFESVMVSSLGRAFNVASSKFLRGTQNGKSIAITVSKNGRQSLKVLALLVAEAFVPVPDDLMNKPRRVVNIDGNMHNNEAVNLMWVGQNQRQDLGDHFVPDVAAIRCKDPDGSHHVEQWRRFRNSHCYVSTMGRLYSTNKMSLLTAYETPLGYYRNRVSGYGNFFIHRVVAEAFIPHDPDRQVVNHKDGNPKNNAVWNLEWVTPKENARHASAMGLLRSGSEHPNAVFTDELVDYLRSKYSSGQHTFQSLANEIGVSRHAVARVIAGKSDYKSNVDPQPTSTEAARSAKSQGARKHWSQSEKARRQLVERRRSFKPRRLSNDEVLEIREGAASGVPHQMLADGMGLPLYTVAAVVYGRSYNWVTARDSTPPKPGPKDLAEKARRGLVDRYIITADVIDEIVKLKLDGMKTKEIATRTGLHPGTVKVIVQNRHSLQRRGLAPKVPDREAGQVRGSITPEMILEMYRRHLWYKEPAYRVGRDLGITAPSQDTIMRGKHYLQREGAVLLPDQWLLENPRL